jgi:hypothetical protein
MAWLLINSATHGWCQGGNTKSCAFPDRATMGICYFPVSIGPARSTVSRADSGKIQLEMLQPRAHFPTSV